MRSASLLIRFTRFSTTPSASLLIPSSRFSLSPLPLLSFFPGLRVWWSRCEMLLVETKDCEREKFEL